MITLKKFIELDNKLIVKLPANRDVPKDYRSVALPPDLCSLDNVFVKAVLIEQFDLGCNHASHTGNDCPTKTYFEYELWIKDDRQPDTWKKMGTITNQWGTNPLEQFEIDKTE